MILPDINNDRLIQDDQTQNAHEDGKGRCARDALPHTFNISVFKAVKIILPQ